MIHQPANSSEFYQSLKFADRNFVQFFTPQQQSCKKIDSFVQSTCKDRGIHLIRANTDKVPNLRNTYMIDVIPTFLLMDKEGKILDVTKGAQEENVMKLVNQSHSKSFNNLLNNTANHRPAYCLIYGVNKIQLLDYTEFIKTFMNFGLFSKILNLQPTRSSNTNLFYALDSYFLQNLCDFYFFMLPLKKKF